MLRKRKLECGCFLFVGYNKPRPHRCHVGCSEPEHCNFTLIICCRVAANEEHKDLVNTEMNKLKAEVGYEV